MDYTRYKKNVVMLNEQNRDFALDRNKPVTGYIKLETGEGKGALRIGGENLRYYEKGKYAYKLILFGKQKEKTIYKVLGSLSINNKGVGESYLSFDPVNIDGKGNRFDDYNVAVLVAVSINNTKEPLHPILRGTLPFEEEEKKTVRAARNYSGYYHKFVLSTCQDLEDKRDLYDNIIPFKEDITGAKWKKISKTNRFPIVSPDTQYILSRYRHFIFGIGKQHYFIGVPGRYMEREQPEGGMSGFTFWQPIVGAENYYATEQNAPLKNRQAAYGYWIAAVSKDNGIIEEFTKES